MRLGSKQYFLFYFSKSLAGLVGEDEEVAAGEKGREDGVAVGPHKVPEDARHPLVRWAEQGDELGLVADLGVLPLARVLEGVVELV